MQSMQAQSINEHVDEPSGAHSLPLPSELERGASEVDSQRSQTGKDYLPQLSSGDNVYPEDSSCSMDPMHFGTWMLSYAGWRFYLPDYGSEQSIQLEVNPEMPLDWSDSYLGLSNHQTDSWTWYSIPEDGLVQLGDLQQMVSDVTQSLFVVVLTDREEKLSVASLRFGGDQYPVARIRADNHFVNSGTMVSLKSKGSSYFEAGWAKTEFDPEGDGNWIDAGGSSSLGHLYTDEGFYTAGLRITDGNGNIAYDYTNIYVSDGPYFEHEDNDGPEQASHIPGEDFSGFTGNIGNAGPHADSEDWYSFRLEQSALIKATLTVSGVGGYVFIDLYREVEGAEPLLVARKSTITSRYFQDTFPPGDYLLAVRDNFETEDMNRDYDVEMLVSTSQHPVVVVEPWISVSNYLDVFEIDLSNSYDPDGSIVKWEIDLFGDGSFEEASVIDGHFLYASLKRPGTFEAMARVTDDSGVSTEKSFTVSFEGEPAYNFLEQEPNSSGNNVQLPALDFSGFRGVLGDGTDWNDTFFFSTAEEGEIELVLEILNDMHGDLSMFLERKVGEDWVAVDSHMSGDGSITAAGMPAGDYNVRIHANYGSTMYDLSATFTP